ncbi:glyoxalase [Bacillus cereus group sp. BfR-BA-01524]|uniref:glyoxalase n=1 Tax=Bacillus cereus group sp. BfR-BA-01524 TaxID=2920372 RepID=UPI001F5A3B12
MKKVIEEYINHLKQSAVENRKESDKAYENGDLGLSGYLRGQWIANEGIATALETILTQHREGNVSSNLIK